MTSRSSSPDRVPLYRAKITHLERLIADLDHDWERLPKLFFVGLAAIPVAIFVGFVWGFLTLVLAFCLVGVVAYITGVRRREYADERDMLLVEIDRVQRGEARVDAPPPPDTSA